MAKGKNGGGFKESRSSRPAKGGEVDPTLEELQRVLAQTPSQPTPLPVEVPPRDHKKDEADAEIGPAVQDDDKFADGLMKKFDAFIAAGQQAPEPLPKAPVKHKTKIKPPQIRTQRFAPRGSRMRNYDEDGRPATQPDTRVYSEEPEIKKGPELSRKRSRTQTPSTSSVANASDFEQIETKPGVAWKEQKSEPKVRIPRERRQMPIDDDPLIQVESKTVGKDGNPGEAMTNAIVKNYRGQAVPMEILDAYDSLMDRHRESSKSGDTAEQESVARDIASFIATQTEATAHTADVAPKPADAEASNEPVVETKKDEVVNYDPGQFFVDVEIPESIAQENTIRGAEQTPEEQKDAGLPAVFHNNRKNKGDGAFLMDAPIIPNPEDAADQEHLQEILGKSEVDGKSEANAERHKLRVLIDKLVGGAKEKIGAMSERGGELAGYLAERGKALDARGAELSEKYFGKLGEKYNKLPTWQKIALGSTLAMGLGLTSSWIAGAYGAALFSTRFAAMAGSFKNNEKLLDTINKGEASGRLANTSLYKWLASGSEENRKNTAMAKALVTSFGMTAALGIAAKELSDYHVADRIGSWIGEHIHNWTHADAGVEAVGVGVSEVAPSPTPAGTGTPGIDHTPASAATPEIPQPAAVVASEIPQPETADVSNTVEAAPAPATVAPEVPVAETGAETTADVAPEVPTVASVEVQAGKGYEYTMKRLMEKLPADFDKTKFHEGSDMRRLLDADPKSVNTVLHDIAKENGFFKPDDLTSVRIDAGAQMSVDADGDIFRGNTILAPEGAPVTPVYHPEVPSAPIAEAPHPGGIVPPDTGPSAVENQSMGQVMDSDTVVAPGPEIVPTPAEAPAPATLEPLQEVDVVSPETIQTVDITHDQEIVGSTTEVPAVPETITPPSLSLEHAAEFTNPNNVLIDPLQGHVFQDPSGAVLAYGNDFDMRFNTAQEYVKANHDAIVWVQAEKPVFYENEWRPWVFQVKYSGFGPFGSVQAIIPTGLPDVSHIGAIKPDTFIKQLDK